jgi:aryl-alcohol dehydrogenase-like predicted oxidoreductase
MSALSRREFLTRASAGVFAADLLARSARPQGEAHDPKPIPERDLGRTGRRMPMLGLGCFPLGTLGSEADGVAVVARALESGARYFDTAPSYADGVSERRVGKGLKGFPREKLWIATKTLERDGDRALAELERSLERLGMEYVDCVQVHEVRSSEDVAGLFGKGAVIAALESAREKNKIRHIGITGHRDPAFLVEAIGRYAFATALVPVNPLDTLHRSFTKEFLPKAREKGVAVIAMKIYAGGALLHEGSKVTAPELVRFALAQPGVCVAVPGADSIEHWDEARAAAVEPLPDAEAQAKLIERAGPHLGKKSEWYKNL